MCVCHSLHSGGETMVKRRGRPRKYVPNVVISPPVVSVAVVGNLTPVNASAGLLNGGLEQQQQTQLAGGQLIIAAPVSSVLMEEASVKKGRGRPPGLLNKKQKGEAPGIEASREFASGFVEELKTNESGTKHMSLQLEESEKDVDPRHLEFISAVENQNIITRLNQLLPHKSIIRHGCVKMKG